MTTSTLTASPSTPTGGIGIQETAQRLRHYAAAGRALLKAAAGRFLSTPRDEDKYTLAYHAYDYACQVTDLRQRLAEMRGGSPDASIRPALHLFLQEIQHAPTDDQYYAGAYGVAVPALLAALRADLQALDPSANANEHRLFRRLAADLEAQLSWAAARPLPSDCDWVAYLRDLLAAAGGFHGENLPATPITPRRPAGSGFIRPGTILFDHRIRRADLTAYSRREELPPREATIEQFKVFFNELYAAALLASLLYDAEGADYPWEFFADFTRHFWDEARHSEFGAIRLRELGAEPAFCNPILFEQSEGMPILHRITYLTRGLESYFMPRKPKRFQEYGRSGDLRSQLFADQDWSDEINHVRYGSRWTEFLLENDARTVADVIEECKTLLSRIRGHEVTSIDAPF